MEAATPSLYIRYCVTDEFVGKVREKRGRNVDIYVLDLGSGKGGDQKKWKIANVKKVIHAGL